MLACVLESSTHMRSCGVRAGVRTMPDNDEHNEGFIFCPSCENAFQPTPRGMEVCDLTFSHIPKVLKGCLHTICQSCAEDALQRSENASSIKCPLCGLLTSDVTTTSALQDNIMALQDVRRKNSYCDFCDDDTVQASHVCNECEGLLCAFHVNSHAVSRGTKSHTVVSLKDKAREGSVPRILHHCVPITCARHPGVPAKLFCSEPCGATICHDCSVAEHSGHTVYLADSEEVELSHRTGLTRRTVTLGHRLAKVQGALDAVEAAKTGVEHHTRMAEKSAVQIFASLRSAVDSREKAVLENLRADRASKIQDLNKQLNELNETVNAYAGALETTDTSLKYLHGNQLLAMEPTLRACLDKHEANFLSLEREPCVEDRVEFEHDRDVAVALRLGISQVGYLAQTEAEFRNAPDRKQKRETSKAPAQEVHTSSTPKDRKIHFTLAAIVGARPQEFTSATATDVVVVEIRNGSEHDFLKNGKPGLVIGRVALHTKFRGAKHLTYESEHFFESLSQQAAPKRQQRVQQQRRKQDQEFSSCYGINDDIPTVRFTKTLRVSGRRKPPCNKV